MSAWVMLSAADLQLALLRAGGRYPGPNDDILNRHFHEVAGEIAGSVAYGSKAETYVLECRLPWVHVELTSI